MYNILLYEIGIFAGFYQQCDAMYNILRREIGIFAGF